MVKWKRFHMACSSLPIGTQNPISLPCTTESPLEAQIAQRMLIAQREYRDPWCPSRPLAVQIDLVFQRTPSYAISIPYGSPDSSNVAYMACCQPSRILLIQIDSWKDREFILRLNSSLGARKLEDIFIIAPWNPMFWTWDERNVVLWGRGAQIAPWLMQYGSVIGP
jgi:hypothetical protein